MRGVIMCEGKEGVDGNGGRPSTSVCPLGSEFPKSRRFGDPHSDPHYAGRVRLISKGSHTSARKQSGCLR